MVDKIPLKSEILGLVEAQAETLESISQRIVKIESLTDKQEARNQNVIQIVLVGFIIIVVTVAVEVILSTTADNSRFDTYFGKKEVDKIEYIQKINTLEKKDIDIQNQIDLLKAKNSYLK